MKFVAKMLGIVAIGGALATTACQNNTAPAAAEGAPAVAAAPVAAAVPADNAGKPADPGTVATAPVAAGEVAKAGEADCPFHHEGAEAAGDGTCATPGGCDHEAAQAASEAHFGDAFTLTEAKPLAAVVAADPAGAEAVVQVSGTIHEVCQKAGCWMVVRDGDAEARVVMKGHAFSVPKDAKGKPTVVEGVLQVRTFSEAQVKHLAEDAGKDPATVSGDAKEFVVTASAVSIKG